MMRRPGRKASHAWWTPTSPDPPLCRLTPCVSAARPGWRLTPARGASSAGSRRARVGAFEARQRDGVQLGKRDAHLDGALEPHAQLTCDVILRVGPCLHDQTDDERVASHPFEAPQFGVLDHTCAPLGVFREGLGSIEERLLDVFDDDVDRHREVDDDPRPSLRHVADARDLAVAHVPEGAVDVTDMRDPHGHVLDDAGGEAEIDDIPDADLVLRDDEDAVEHVFDDVLCTEAETCADGGGQERERAEDRVVDQLDAQEDGDDRERHVDDVLQDGAERAGASTSRTCASGDASIARVSSTFAFDLAPATMRFTTRRMTSLQPRHDDGADDDRGDAGRFESDVAGHPADFVHRSRGWRPLARSYSAPDDGRLNPAARRRPRMLRATPPRGCAQRRDVYCASRSCTESARSTPARFSLTRRRSAGGASR